MADEIDPPAVEPDGIMSGPLWPHDWQTGWVSWRFADMLGNPITGNMTLSLSVKRTVSPTTHITVYGGSLKIPLADGVPSGPRVVVNSEGVPCIEVPLNYDPEVQPIRTQLVATEDWSGQTHYRTVTAEHTLDNPLWLSGNLASVARQPGVLMPTGWKVEFRADGPPPEAAVGEFVWYLDAGLITQITEL